MERERARWLEEESRMKVHEEERIRHLEDKRRREKVAAQQLLQVEIETLKATHGEHLAQLKKKWEEDKNEEMTALKHTLEMNFNERERRLLENQRKEREEEAQKLAAHFASELARDHVLFSVFNDQVLSKKKQSFAVWIFTGAVENVIRPTNSTYSRKKCRRDQKIRPNRI